MDELAEDAGTALEIFKLKAPDVSFEVSEPVDGDSSFSDPGPFGLPSTLSNMGVDWEGLELSEFETYEPLGIMVELAKSGKIDPWDIDIVELTDNFLGRVEELKKMDLRISSRTLLYSAILLRMKSSGILEEDVPEEEPDFFDYDEFPEPEKFPIPKLPVRRLSTRPVTLNELISELRKAEKALSRKYDKKARQASEAREAPKGPQLSTGDVLDIAHDEAISVRLDLIWDRLSKLFQMQPYVVFSVLMEESEDRVMDYISLLFLASSKKVWLCQKELFGELFIYPGAESGFSTEHNPSSFHENSLQNGAVSGHEVPGTAVSPDAAVSSDTVVSPVIAVLASDGKGSGESSLRKDALNSEPVEVFSVEVSPVESNPLED
ncbi:Segregation and condensation protein A [Methanosarcina sp. MTP4]|uniref:segregation/condensation protein A n=1 Tax=Methanosarcina sp. MTP4 TaxID=1434100 RepID=UPI000615E21E|nr:ScpA family protein [Methanosarcina sp. MTP4]AKB23773.1 Segregation and condensation protein A [Methanosarcina sp. MTP4]